MTIDPWQLLDEASTVLAVHAHPDDESLSTGALIAALTASGTRVELVTATRGEEGEVVPGAVEPEDTRPLELIREAEIDEATATLGIAARHMLGTAPALAAGADPRVYRDSGMQWIREGLAGPSDTTGPDSFTRRPLEDAVADLVALIEHVRPDVVVGYDDGGTYGHPDHVQAHHVAAAACTRTGTPMLEVASGEAPEGADGADGADGRSAADAFLWRDHPGTGETVRRAAESYRTQLGVVGWAGPERSDGIAIRHVGGQDDLVPLRTGLRLRR
ncbi:PIG-L deacetylase family protein [Brachybacterium alimentarium]|uniref:GlcNAc-PI de-N-acetylase n=1 Tax=Brachybacterium alimentarium TaxID=47845 RepID=A0A2A3YHK4_9MICO|nr:PIG-L family deacetylase [Brachybacterium alimentarium]PCC38800.1 GlcNAc-PI de-N-acetylase [Brachybacterium alimentarium]RCS80340.1 GlcNAc-PI de-N-acetylase [Brachybacterium alimentarium]RCS83061.1 GlcNAc-PI de-N-acetylase [Brachybacterium alimentarium]RCS85321.1 GlcNAc-PI de-N-acetylase [Brachybacterium alimentarium]